MTIPPLTYVRKGMALVPIGRHQNRFGDAFAEGQAYQMVPHEDRSDSSHRHYFALVREYWMNLPERLAREDWAMTPEFLRHYALIRAGWAVPTTYTCGSKAEAMRWARQMPRPVDKDGAPVWHVRNVEGTVLTEIVPRSQAYRGMGKGNFQKSKDDVLGFLESLVGGEATGTAA